MNTGAKPIYVSLRVDNAGDWKDSPWNCEAISLKPGEGRNAHDDFRVLLRPAARLRPQAGGGGGSADLLHEVRRGAVVPDRVAGGGRAGGEKPPVDPESVRIKPEGGVMLGAGTTIDAAKQIEAKDAKAELVAEGGSNRSRSPSRPVPPARVRARAGSPSS